MATTPALEVRDLQKSFGGVPVLRWVSLSLFPGQVTGLAGENGAGKSALMKMATGQLRQDGGAVLIDAEVVSHPDPLQEAGRCGCSSGTSAISGPDGL